jgi:hypothetical protein
MFTLVRSNSHGKECWGISMTGGVPVNHLGLIDTYMPPTSTTTTLGEPTVAVQFIDEQGDGKIYGGRTISRRQYQTNIDSPPWSEFVADDLWLFKTCAGILLAILPTPSMVSSATLPPM